MEIHQELIKVYEHPETRLRMNTSDEHLEVVEKSLSTMKYLQCVTKLLQSKEMTLSTGWRLLDELKSSVLPVLESIDDFYFNNKRITFDYRINPLMRKAHYLFASAILKLQRGLEDDLTPEETPLVSKLHMNHKNNRELYASRQHQDTHSSSNPSNFSHQDDLLMEKLHDAFVRSDDVSRSYIPCAFIGCSTAHVERLWSTCNLILTNNRASLSIEMFEALIFLRYNRDMWGMDEVLEACRIIREEYCSINEVDIGCEDDIDAGFEDISDEQSDVEEDDDIMPNITVT